MRDVTSSPSARFPWHRWLLGAVALLVVGLFLGLRRPGGLTQRLAEIRARGQPTNLEELERSLGADAMVGRSNAARLTDLGIRLRLDTGRKLPSRSTNTAEDIAWARMELTGGNAPVFAELHEQLAVGPWCFVSATRGPSSSIDYLSTVKGLANALQMEAIGAALLGDTQRAAGALLAGLQVGRTLESGGLYSDYLVRVVCDSIAAQAAEGVFSRLQLTDAQLEALQQAFRRAEGTNALGSALIGERAYGLALMKSPLGLGGTSGMDAVWGVLYRIFIQTGDQIYYVDQMGELIASTALPGPAALAAQRDQESKFSSSVGGWRRPLSRMTLPALYKSAEIERRHLAIQRCARTGCAVERFRALNGRLPSTLDELVPGLLEAVPTDPGSGESLKYRRLERGYVVYGLGEDGTDDGGAERANRTKGATKGWDDTFTVER